MYCSGDAIRVGDAYTRGEYPTRIHALLKYKELSHYTQNPVLLINYKNITKLGFIASKKTREYKEFSRARREYKSTSRASRCIHCSFDPAKSLNLKLSMQTQGRENPRGGLRGFKKWPPPHLCVWCDTLLRVTLCSICVPLSSAHFLSDASMIVLITCIPDNKCASLIIIFITCNKLTWFSQ